jgi:hypothetical protein
LSSEIQSSSHLQLRCPDVRGGRARSVTGHDIVESAFSLLKRGIVGTWHKVSAKHLPAYLDEMCFRFNNRKNPYLFRDTIIRLIQT